VEIWQIIVSVCAGLLTLCTLAEKVWKYTRPVATADRNIKDVVADTALLKTALAELHGRVAKMEVHQDNDLKELHDHTKANKVVCSALLALLDHELSGNHAAQLEDAKKRIQTYLIER
jgi:hypothetical protein